MSPFSSSRRPGRREFVEQALLGTGVLCLASVACADIPRGPRHLVLPDRPIAPDRSTVAVVRTTAFASYREAVRAVVERAGGLAFAKPGQSVLLKPALNSGKAYPATTDPELVLAMALLVKETGAIPFVADRTMFMARTEDALRATGIAAAAKEAGIRCLALDDAEVVSLAHPLATHWAGSAVPIYRPVAEADHVINLCTPRTHKIGDFTMSMKNWVGVVSGRARMGMHGPFSLKERLAEISLVVRPSFIVMDGRQGFTSGGPDSGDLAHPGFLAAGSDPLAIDAVGLAFLRREGAAASIGKGSIWSIPVMARAAELGIGASAAERITLVGMEAGDEKSLRAQMA